MSRVVHRVGCTRAQPQASRPRHRPAVRPARARSARSCSSCGCTSSHLCSAALHLSWGPKERNPPCHTYCHGNGWSVLTYGTMCLAASWDKWEETMDNTSKKGAFVFCFCLCKVVTHGVVVPVLWLPGNPARKWGIIRVCLCDVCS